MQLLKFTVRDQVIHYSPCARVVVAESRGHVFASFDLDEEWAGLGIVATFTNDYVASSFSVPLSGDQIAVPPEVLVAGTLRVALEGLGDEGAVRLTTENMDKPIAVHRAGQLVGLAPGEASPELWELVLAQIGNLSNLDTIDKSSLVAAINEVAKNGGSSAPGNPGKDGITPHIGANGNWYIGETDTGVKAQGEDGVTPDIVVGRFTETGGKGGVNIRVSTPTEDGLVNVTTAKVYDGVDGKDGSHGSDGSDGVSPTVSVSKSGKVTTLSITDKNGTKTATINDGADGSPGSAGKDGTSVTVKSVSESAADGGSNVVTFSDGKTITIKNGSKGSTGATGATGATGPKPVKGTDYWTEADKEEIVQQVIIALGTPVFGRVDADNNIILTGELAEGVYTLKYEDAEGNVTEIGKVVVGDSYTNQIPISTDTDGSVYNTTGYKTASRISSSGGISNVSNVNASNPAFVTGFIPCKSGDIIRLKNCFIDTDGTGNDSAYYGQDIGGLRITVYNASKSWVTACAWSEYASSGLLENYAVDENGYITEFSIKNSNCAFVRLCLGGDPANAIVTINEEITD